MNITKNYDFNGDTTAPVCPEIMEKLLEINNGNMFGYSQDEYTKKAREVVGREFSKPVDIHFVTSGSGANVLAIKQVKKSYSSIICCDDTHINRYEVGGVEYNTGCKIVAVDSPDAKITVEKIASRLKTRDSFNWAIPQIVVLSQVTELGTTYTNAELKAICDFCHANDLLVYVDGARLANALVDQNTTLKEMMEDTGVDIFTFGANKNGAMFGEMIVFLNKDLAKNFIWTQKQSLMLFSKTRFLGAQFLVMFEQGVWKKNATHANAMAKYLEAELAKISVYPALPVQSNAVFANFTQEQLTQIKKVYALSSYDSERSFVRLMTNWATTKQQVDDFVQYVKNCSK